MESINKNLTQEIKAILELGFRETKPLLFNKRYGDYNLYYDYRTYVRKTYGFDSNGKNIIVDNMKEHKTNKEFIEIYLGKQTTLTK